MSLRPSGRHKIFKIQDFIFEKILFLFVLLFVLILVGLFLVLFKESLLTFKEIGVLKFIFGTDWDPDEELFGALPHIYGTVVTTLIAILLATPLGFGIAIFLSELCPKRLKPVIGTLVEILAAIPSIIYGMWGLYVLVPLMSQYMSPPFTGCLKMFPS